MDTTQIQTDTQQYRAARLPCSTETLGQPANITYMDRDEARARLEASITEHWDIWIALAQR